MKLKADVNVYGLEKAGKQLETTIDTIRWIIKLGLIKPIKFPIGLKGVLLFTLADQKIIKSYLTKKKKTD